MWKQLHPGQATLTGGDLDAGPDWPTGDAAALTFWLEEERKERLGREPNKWIGVIDYASLQIRGSETPGERRAFRDLAVAAADAGWAQRGLPRSVYVEKQIHARITYIRLDDADASWRRDEMAQIFDLCRQQVPLVMESAHEKSKDWQERPATIVAALREIKTLLGLMSFGAEYLDGERANLLEEWLKIPRYCGRRCNPRLRTTSTDLSAISFFWISNSEPPASPAELAMTNPAAPWPFSAE